MGREPRRDWRSEVARLDASASHENLSTQVAIPVSPARDIPSRLAAALPIRSGEAAQGDEGVRAGAREKQVC